MLAKVREAVGRDVLLLTDGNGAFTLPQAVKFGKELEKLDFYCFEVPLPQGLNYAGYDVLTESLTYTRSLVADLSPSVLREHGLVAGLRWLAEWMERHNLRVLMESDADTVSLPYEQAILLFQSVRELLMNSAKHARSDHAWLSVTSAAGALCVTVRDEGAGFDPVSAMEESAETTSKFGLFSIRERMTAVGGSLHIETARGRGTTSVLRLPYCHGLTEPEARQQTVPAPMAVAPARPAPGSPIGVILVDDHAMIREGLQAVLANYADITLLGEAADGEAGVALVRHIQPAVVIMDINMPVLNGIEATARIKQEFPHVVVIGLSVNADAENQDAMKQAGAACLLTKEAAVNELYHAIHANLG